MIGVSEAGRRWLERAAEGPRRYCSALRASVALESVCCICFAVGILGGVFDIVNTMFVSDILDRAAQAVVRDNSLQLSAATDREQLLERAWNAIHEEVGDRLDPDLVTVDIKVYDNPSKMLAGEESTGDNSLLGGDAGDMVVVRLGFAPETLVARLRSTLAVDESDVFFFHALAVARNERAAGLPAPLVAGLAPAGGPAPSVQDTKPPVTDGEAVAEI